MSTRKRRDSDLRTRAERSVPGQERALSQMTPDDVANLVHEFEVNQVEMGLQKEELQTVQRELEIQNQELRDTQRELVRSRDRYADLFDNAPVGYFIIDASAGRIVEANLTGRNMLSIGGRILGTFFFRYLDPEFSGELRLCIKKAFQNSVKEQCEVRIRRSGGPALWALLEVVGLPGSGQVRIAVMDITDRKRIEEELRIKDYAIGSAPAGIAITDLEGHLTYVNPALCRMGGFEEVEVLGRRVHEFFSDKKQADEAMKSVLSIGSWEGESKSRRRDGSTFDISVKANLVTDREGKPVCTMASLIDVTQRMRAEDALRESERQYRALFEHMSEAMVLGEIIFDRNGDPHDYRILDLNDVWAGLWGIEREQAIGRTRREIMPVKDPFFIQTVAKVALTGEPARFERYSLALCRWFEVHVYSPRKGQFVQLSVDISERRKADLIKDDFIGMVSHELKTPLTVVTGAISTAMSEGIAPREARSLLEDAVWGVDTMADIVDNLLELSRWQANRLALTPAPLDIGLAVSGLVKQSSKKSAQHRIVAEVSPGLPVISADRTRIQRILDNLVDNAIKYSPNGGEVRVTARQEGDGILLSVRDQGLGIAASDIKKLFQPFQRIETPVLGSTIQGVGLGLVVCRRLVEAHGGSIWVESVPGEGSTFYFTLPLKDHSVSGSTQSSGIHLNVRDPPTPGSSV